MSNSRNAQMKAARTAYYRFLSRMYSAELNTEIIEALKKMDFSEDAGNALIREGLARLKKFTGNIPDPDELAADYAKVFLAAGEAKGGAAFPYESVYTSKEKLLMQDSWEQVKKFYMSKGIALQNAASDIKEDHISAELVCMAYLIENDMEEEAYTFLNEHLLNWTDRFAADIEKYALYDVYPAIGKLTLGFLEMEKQFFENEEEWKSTETDTKSYALSHEEMDRVIEQWKKEYRVFAPKLQTTRGDQKSIVRYGEVNSAAEIYNERTSDFSAKEVYYPIMQTMFYFTDTEVIESKIKDEREVILLLHPCDINALRRTDNIFLKNGAGADLYYERLRKKIRIVLLECKGSSDNCFCVSMDSNRAENYEMAIRLEENGVKVQVKEAEWNRFFEHAAADDFTPAFVSENRRKVSTPVIRNREELRLASELKYWEKFNEECISCGGCNTVCPTCSCFDTNDIIYSELSKDGERRRVWSSCMLDTFTMTAGGARARKTPGANMRFKTLHKVYDYQKRFNEGENMCVGCGRCVIRCPKEIDFSKTLNDFTAELEKAKGGAANE